MKQPSLSGTELEECFGPEDEQGAPASDAATAAAPLDAIEAIQQAVIAAEQALHRVRKSIATIAPVGSPSVPGHAIEALTPRQRQIAELVAEGWSDLNIACRLGLSESTVGNHLREVFARLAVHSRAQVAARFKRG